MKQHDNPCVGQVLRLVGGERDYRTKPTTVAIQLRESQKGEATGQPHSGK